MCVRKRKTFLCFMMLKEKLTSLLCSFAKNRSSRYSYVLLAISVFLSTLQSVVSH